MNLVLVIADIGGPVALHNLLSEMPANFPAPIVVLQSSEIGLLESSMGALKRTIPLKVAMLNKQTTLCPRSVFFGTPQTVYFPAITDSRTTVEGIKVEQKDEHIRQTVENFAAAYRHDLTAVFLSGKGREKEIASCCAILEAAGCAIMVLSRLEAVVFDMGRQVLATSKQAQELTAAEIAASLALQAASVSSAGVPLEKAARR